MLEAPLQAKKANQESLFAVVAVSLYLAVVGAWLILTRQIPAPGLGKVLRYYLRPRYSGELKDFVHESGNCWLAKVPAMLPSEADSASKLMLFEDAKPLAPRNAPHDEIRKLGGGRFSHWYSQLYFSTSDNSDPRTNGRRYTVRER
jgi:hypothetical protein